MVQAIQQIIEFPLSFVFGGRCPCLQVEQVLRCCLFEDSQDPTVQLVVIPVVVQRQIPWSRHSVGSLSSPGNTVADVPIVQVVLAIPVVRRQVRKAQTLLKTVEVTQLQFIKFVDISCCVQRPIPMVLVTMERVHSCSSIWFPVPVMWLCSSTGAGCGGDSRDPSVASCSSPSCRRHLCRGAEAVSLGCGCSADH